MNNHFEPNPKPIQTEEEMRLRAAKITNAVAFPMVLKAAFGLGVIDTLSAAGEGAWLSPSEIARGLRINPTNQKAPMLLDRLLRVLTSYSVVKCRTVRREENGRTGETERVYAAEPVCRFFLNDNGDSGSLVPLFMLLHSDVMLKSWNFLKDAIQEGRDAFSSAHGMRIFEYAGSNERFNELFNLAMSESTTMIIKKVLEVYRGFENVNVLVDVGGGVGVVSGMITSKYPEIKGINFDLLSVLTNAPSYPGVEHIAGDMFVEIPKGDTILMKWILHDWNDKDCLKILKNCWKAVGEKGKVIIIETVIPDEPKSEDVYSNIAFDFDMLMMSQCSGGKERTKHEFEELAIASGFRCCEFFCCASPYWVIEFHK